jgi:hypothetical protein
VAVRASLAESGLAAMAVRNMAEETQEVWKQVTERYAPSFRSVPSVGRLLAEEGVQRQFFFFK